MNELSKSLGQLIIVLLSVIVSVLLSGLIVLKFYNWFLLPIFTLPIISYYQAIGISFFITLFNFYEIKKREEESFEEKYERIFQTIMQKPVLLLIGYVFKILLL